jgi:hypothetical protein
VKKGRWEEEERRKKYRFKKKTVRRSRKREEEKGKKGEKIKMEVEERSKKYLNGIKVEEGRTRK